MAIIAQKYQFIHVIVFDLNEKRKRIASMNDDDINTIPIYEIDNSEVIGRNFFFLLM
jgi:hypothetical protein